MYWIYIASKHLMNKQSIHTYIRPAINNRFWKQTKKLRFMFNVFIEMIRLKNKSLYSSFTVTLTNLACASQFQFYKCMNFFVTEIVTTSLFPLCVNGWMDHIQLCKKLWTMPVKGCSCPFNFYCLADHFRFQIPGHTKLNESIQAIWIHISIILSDII